MRSAAVAMAVSGLFLAFGWAARFPHAFPDLINYRDGFSSGWYVFSILNLGWVDFILSEGAWVYGFDALWSLIGNIEKTFLAVSAFSILLIVYYIYSKSRSIVATLFIFNPAFINLAIEQLRSGLATAIFLTATQIKSRYIQGFLFVLALSIHTSFLLFAAFYYMISLADSTKISRYFDSRPVRMTLALMAVAFLIAYFRDFALTSIGDDRAFITTDQTSGYFLAVAWALFIVTFNFLRPAGSGMNFDIYFFYLNVFMFVASIMMGSYGARFVAIAIPSLAVMSSQLEGNGRKLFLAHYFLFSAVYFAFWLSA